MFFLLYLIPCDQNEIDQLKFMFLILLISKLLNIGKCSGGRKRWYQNFFYILEKEKSKATILSAHTINGDGWQRKAMAAKGNG